MVLLNSCRFQISGSWASGTIMALSQGHTRVVTVTSVKGDMVMVDGNHPLAGEEDFVQWLGFYEDIDYASCAASVFGDHYDAVAFASREEMHQKMAATLEDCILDIRRIQQKARSSGKADASNGPSTASTTRTSSRSAKRSSTRFQPSTYPASRPWMAGPIHPLLPARST